MIKIEMDASRSRSNLHMHDAHEISIQNGFSKFKIMQIKDNIFICGIRSI